MTVPSQSPIERMQGYLGTIGTCKENPTKALTQSRRLLKKTDDKDDDDDSSNDVNDSSDKDSSDEAEQPAKCESQVSFQSLAWGLNCLRLGPKLINMPMLTMRL